MFLRRIVMNVEAGAGGSAGTPAGGSQNQGAGTPAAAGGTSDWVSGLPENVRGYVANKGFKDPSMVVDAYQNLERLIGLPKERLLKLPEKPDDPSWGEIYGKLGRPEKPEGYQLEVPKEGGDKAFVEWAAKNFHELNLTRKQGESLVTKWNELQASKIEAQKTATQQAQESQRATIKKEWGAAYTDKLKSMELGAQKLGLSPEHVDKIGQALGIDNTARLLEKVGTAMGEGRFITGADNGRQFGPLAPVAARDRIQTLMHDPDFSARYLKGETSAREEMNRLHEWANPTEQAG